MHTTPSARPTRLRRLGAAALAVSALTVAGTLAGCSTDDVVLVNTGSESKAGADHLAVTDAWVKAARSGMTGVFATLANDGDTALTVTSVSTDAASRVELHETVSDSSGGMTMQPKKGGVTIDAGDSHELAPGGDHIMLMGLRGPLTPGDRVVFTLRLSDGSAKTATALVKDFTGAQENYSGGAMSGGIMSDGGS